MNNLTAYLIDDSAVDLIISEKKILSALGIERVVSFDSSIHALEKITEQLTKKETLPDIILLDIMMPGLDGFEWIDELDDLIDSSFSPIVIILSGTNLKSHFEDFEKQRISQEFLAKPLDTAELNEIIKRRIFSKSKNSKIEKKKIKF